MEEREAQWVVVRTGEERANAGGTGRESSDLGGKGVGERKGGEGWWRFRVRKRGVGTV